MQNIEMWNLQINGYLELWEDIGSKIYNAHLLNMAISRENRHNSIESISHVQRYIILNNWNVNWCNFQFKSNVKMMKNDILLTPGYFMKNCMPYNYINLSYVMY